MNSEELRERELILDTVTGKICVIVRFFGTDFTGANLYEVTDGRGKYWLTRECMIYRLEEEKSQL
jgi:hypothetical protein